MEVCKLNVWPSVSQWSGEKKAISSCLYRQEDARSETGSWVLEERGEEHEAREQKWDRRR